jgi:PAS domain S-box-containing protein
MDEIVCPGPPYGRDRETADETDQRFRLIFEHHDAVMLLVDPESGAIVDVNKAAAQFYGYSRTQLCAMHITDINTLAPEQVAAERQRAKREKRNLFFFPHRLANGDIRMVEVHSSPVEVRGRLLLFSIVHDVTDRKKAEEELHRHQEHLEELISERTHQLEMKNRDLEREIVERKRAEEVLKESEQRYNRFFRTSMDCVFITSKDGRWIDLNDAAVRLFGYASRDELLQVNISALYARPEERETHTRMIIERGCTLEFPIHLLKKDGTVMHTLITSVAIRDKQGDVVGYQGTIRDITAHVAADKERERLIDELQKAMARVKMLSGLLPICAWCKKIRDDEGYWQQMEIYIRDHSEADFTHGLCPDCAKKFRSEYLTLKNP